MLIGFVTTCSIFSAWRKFQIEYNFHFHLVIMMAYKIYYHHLTADLWTSCNDFWTSCNAFTIAIALYSSILWPWVICNKVSTALYTFVCVFKTIRVSNGCNQSVLNRARNSDSKSAIKSRIGPMEQILGNNCNQDILRGTVPGTKRSGAPRHQRFLASGAPYPVQNHQGHFVSWSPTQIRAMAVRHRTLGGGGWAFLIQKVLLQIIAIINVNLVNNFQKANCCFCDILKLSIDII